jgi:hypothetical protein
MPVEPRDARMILSQVQELLVEGRELVKPFQAVAEVNAAFVSGKQFGSVTFKNSKSTVARDEWFDDEDVPRIYVNVLGNLVATLVSLITKNRPCAVARALNEDDVEDIYDAEVTNTLIRYLSQELKTVEVIQRAVKDAETHGTGFIKVWFDAQKRKACIAPTTIFNTTCDPTAENVNDGQWFIFHRYLRKSEAKKLIASSSARKDPQEKPYDTSSGIKKKGVPALEVWVRPGYFDEYPRGYYAFIVDDIVIERTDYPFIVKTDTGVESLPPLIGIVAKPVDECIYGETAVTDCIGSQRTLNETISRTLKLIRIASSPKLIRNASVAQEGIDPYTDADIEFPNNTEAAAIAQAIRFLEQPKIPPEARELGQDCIKSIHDTLGVSQLTAGTQTRNVSGKALEEIEGLDAQKNSQTTRSIETGVLDLYRLLLFIVQNFYDDGVKLQISGVSPGEMMLFNKADIMGKDIRLEPASEFDLMQPTMEQSALEHQQAGLASASDVKGAARNPRTAYSRQLAEKLVQQALSGHDVELGADDVDADAMKQVIAKHKHLAMLEGRRADYVSLVDFEKFIDELALEQSQATPAPMPGEPPQAQQQIQPTPPAPPAGGQVQ